MSTGRTSASSGAVTRSAGGGGGVLIGATKSVNGSKTAGGGGRRGLGISSTTLDVSTTDVDHTDVDCGGSVSDVESALRYRVVEAAPELPQAAGVGVGQEEQLQQRQPPSSINGSSPSGVNVCYQPDATACH